MQPNNHTPISIRDHFFGTTSAEGNNDASLDNSDARPVAPTLQNMTQADARNRLAQAGMGGSTDGNHEEDYDGEGGTKRRQPETGFETENTTEPKLQRRMSPERQEAAAQFDAETALGNALLLMMANDSWDPYGNNQLMLAASNGQIKELQQLLALPSAETQAAETNYARWNALMMAAHHGHTDVVQQLLALPSAEAQAADSDKEGWNALMKAVRWGHTDAVQHLLALTSRDFQAAQKNYSQKENALMLAAKVGHTDAVKHLLALPSSETQAAEKNEEGWNALMQAAFHGHSDAVQQLLALPSAETQAAEKEDDGQNAFMLSVYAGDANAVKHFLAIPGIVSTMLQTRNNCGDTVVDIAYDKRRDSPTFGILLAASGAANIPVRYQAQVATLAGQGRPAFLWSLAPNQVRSVINHLSILQVDLRAADETGWNALMYACFAGRSDVVEALLQQGVNASAPMPVGVAPVIRDLVQWSGLVNATPAKLDQIIRSALPDATTIMMRFILETIPLHGYANSLVAAGICHTLSRQLSLSKSDETALIRALSDIPVMTTAQLNLMKAGLLSWLDARAIEQGDNVLGQNALSAPTQQGLQDLVAAQARQLGTIGGDLEAQLLGETLPQLADFSLAYVAGLDNNSLQDEALLIQTTVGLGQKLAERFGLYAVFTQCVQQALVVALQSCRQQLAPLFAMRFVQMLDGTVIKLPNEIADWQATEAFVSFNPYTEIWLPYPTTLGNALAQDEAVAASLQATFITQLMRKINQLDGGYLQHKALADASRTAQRLYTHLAFRQLHMLAQLSQLKNNQAKT